MLIVAPLDAIRKFDVIHQVCGEVLPYNDLRDLRSRMAELSPTLVRYGDLEAANFFSLAHKLIKV